MNMNTSIRGPFRVETAEPAVPGDSTYHAILDEDGSEVGRVHAGDDADAAKRLATLLASAPELRTALQDIFRAFYDVPLSPARVDRVDAMAAAERLLLDLNFPTVRQPAQVLAFNSK
jgi:hypothetical protein